MRAIRASRFRSFLKAVVLPNWASATCRSDKASIGAPSRLQQGHHRQQQHRPHQQGLRKAISSAENPGLACLNTHSWGQVRHSGAACIQFWLQLRPHGHKGEQFTTVLAGVALAHLQAHHPQEQHCPHQQGLRQQCISSTIVLIKVAQNSQLVHLQGHHRQHRPPQRVSGVFRGCGRSKATQQNSQFSVHVQGHHRQQQHRPHQQGLRKSISSAENRGLACLNTHSWGQVRHSLVHACIQFWLQLRPHGHKGEQFTTVLAGVAMAHLQAHHPQEHIVHINKVYDSNASRQQLSSSRSRRTVSWCIYKDIIVNIVHLNGSRGHSAVAAEARPHSRTVSLVYMYKDIIVNNNTVHINKVYENPFPVLRIEGWHA